MLYKITACKPIIINNSKYPLGADYIKLAENFAKVHNYKFAVYSDNLQSSHPLAASFYKHSLENETPLILYVVFGEPNKKTMATNKYLTLKEFATYKKTSSLLEKALQRRAERLTSGPSS